jgi:hypothetical protein
VSAPIPARHPWPTHSPIRLLLDTPTLEGAACKGQAPLWDGHLDTPETPQARRERHQQALEICRTCPVKRACLERRRAYPSLGDGVWGGRLFETTPTQTCHYRACARVFTAVASRRYCTPRCRELAAAERSPRRAQTQRALPGLTHCQHCGTELTAEQRAKNMRNCSPRCGHHHSARVKDQVA